MQMAEQFDISTLAWVKGEIDETLKQARIALESYVEDPDEASQLEACIDSIHQVAGTLQMVELLGAALFAEEVEKFALALQQEQIEDTDAGFELLMRGILQLPDYLESLLSGNVDNPVALVPLLNELRHMRGDSALDSSQFFRPNLKVQPPQRKGTPPQGVTTQAVAKKLHRYYLAALAKIIKGTELSTSLKSVSAVLDKLNAIAAEDNLRRLLWVASAFIEALRDESIALDKQSKPMLAKLEQAIKFVAAKGEEGLTEEAAAKLLLPMLYEIAQSDANGKHAATVKIAFDLESFMPGAVAGLGGLNAELKQTVSSDIIEELTRVKDTFDVFVRSDRKHTESLSPLAESITSIAETLSVLQEDSLQATLQEQLGVINKLISGDLDSSDDTLMGIAGAILAVESALRDWGNTAPVVEADARDEQVSDSETSPEAIAEHQRVTRQVMKEAKDDLIRVREAINNYLDRPQDKTGLEPLPEMIHNVIGSLNMLSYKRVAQVLTSTRAFIENELMGVYAIPEAEQLDALADAVMSVEYYLEAFVQSRVHPSSALDVAENAVAMLGYPIGLVQEPQDESITETPELSGIEVFESQQEQEAGASAPEELESGAETIEVTEEPVESAPESIEEISLTLEEEPEEEAKVELAETTPEVTVAPEPEIAEPKVEQQPEPVAELPAEPEPATAKEEPSAGIPEVDDEILEIFIEEAEEELGTIGELLPAWMVDGDEETLKTIRRSFHTLKGSGRLVGATEVGEFAWAFENMLNKVLDGAVSPGNTMFDLLEQAREALPELIEQFRSGTQPQIDVQMLHDMAFEIVEPGGPKMPEQVQKPEQATPVEAKETAATEVEEIAEVELSDTTPVEEAAPEPAVENKPTEAMPELDPVLLEIYSKEAESHLEELGGFIQAWQDGGSHKVTEPLIRALHTLQGSSRMAGVISVAEVAASLEKYAKTLQANHHGVNEHGIEALESGLEYIRAMIAYLTEGQGTMPDGGKAQQLADAVYAEVQHMEESANAQPEAGLATKEESVFEESAPKPDSTQGETEAAPEEIVVEESAAETEELPDELRSAFEIIGEVETDWGTEVEAQTPPGDEESQRSAEVEQAKESAVEPGAISDTTASTEPQFVEEEYDQELLDIFLEEGTDILDASEETLQAWVDNPTDRSLVESLQRQLHTLKGGARMAGITPVGDLSHSLESTFDAVVEGRIQRSQQMMDLLQLSHDRLVTMLEQVGNHQPVMTGDDLIAKVDTLARGGEIDSAAIPEPVAEPEQTKPQPVKAQESAAPQAVSGEPAAVEIPKAARAPVEPEKGTAELEAAIAEFELNHSSWLRDVDDQAAFTRLKESAAELEKACADAGLMEPAALVASVEKLLAAILDGHVTASKKASDLISLAMDRLRKNVELYKSDQPLEDVRFLSSDIDELINRSLIEEVGATTPEVVEKTEEAAVKQAVVPESEQQKGDAADDKRRGPRIQHEMVRVRADLLDNMVNFAGEVSIYRSRVEQQIGSFGSSIDEMAQTVDRLREQIRQVEIENEAQIESRREEAQKQGYEDFDPLEFDRFTHMQQLSRSMAESLNDLLSIEDILTSQTRETETLLLQQSRVNTELQESLVHTRMVPLVDNAPRLRRIVRQTSAEVGKRTTLNFEGAEVEMDRNVVDRMMAPLEHMLRNSIAHGIEDKQERSRAGKPEEGHITVALSREGSEIVIRVSDDGRGINIDAVRSKAIEKGLMKPDAKLSDREVIRFILESGFSTAESLSQIAGRGVGMDVVNSEIKQLGGVMDIDSEPGKGTSIIVRLPLTLSVSRALLVTVNEDIYAIPLLSISGIERIETGELERLLASENPTFNWVGEEYQLMHLNSVLGVGQGTISEMGKQPLLLARSGEQRIALAVDSLLGSREIVVKSLGPQLSTLQDLAGATILADGSVALIIDMPALVRRGLARQAEEAVVETVKTPEVEREPVVMVVDDSITVRKVTERLLKRHNMRCVTAKDGVDALAVLEEGVPDVMLLDIEMPRMDGFELATHIRNSDRLKGIPIIMITSRTGEKHRQRAMDIGVNIYMGKPYTEVDLMENIETLIGKKS